jgi:outer membrane protein assembly factor BamB
MFALPIHPRTVRYGVAALLAFTLFLGGAAVARGSTPKPADAGVAAAAEAVKANWPQWRGPLASGLAPLADPPTTWAEDKNVRWKVKLPGSGSSTPIVWGDSIFIQTAVPAAATAGTAIEQAVTVHAQVVPPPGESRPDNPGGRRSRGGPGGGGMRNVEPTGPYKFTLLCLDRKTGQARWEKVAREAVPHEGHHKDHGFSSYSPVTDGKLVFAYFGSRGLHCYDVDGNHKWSKDLGRMTSRNGFGEGSSPAVHGDTIVVNWDHQGDDFIVAFDTNTGEERWRQPRDEDQSWSTPLIVEHDGGAQVITSATGRVRSYDLKTGKQVWEAPGLTPNTIPSPVSGDGVVFATAGFRGNALHAIRLGKTGDLTGTDAILWSAKRGTPYVSSPLLYGERLYMFSGNNALLTCFDAKTGKPIVETHRIDDLEGVYASPVAAAGRVYLVGRNGTTVVIKHLNQTDKVEVLATNVLQERIDASPALAGKDLFLRGQQYLYCIGLN